LSGTSVVSDGSGDDTEATTSLGNGGVSSEISNHQEEEGKVKEEEEGDECEVNSQGGQQEDKGDDEPRSQEDRDSVGELFRGLGIGRGDTVVRVEEGREGQPETAIRGESSSAKGVAGGKFPHASSELSKTADEAGHTDDSVGDGDTASANVVHGEDESGAREGEETKGTRVTDDPQLRGGVVDVGVGGEGASLGSSLAVLITDVVGVVVRQLFGGHCEWK